MSNVLDEARGLIQSRLAELNHERSRLERAVVSLGASPKRVASKRKQPRSRRHGTRAEQAVTLVNGGAKGGVTASEIARKLKVKPNYLYRVMGALEKEGRVKKDGRRYRPAS